MAIYTVINKGNYYSQRAKQFILPLCISVEIS